MTALASGLLHTSQVAEIYRVTPRTVIRWADAGLIPSTRRDDGQRRYRASGMPAGPGDLVTGPEAAAALNVAPFTVTRWARAGRIDCITAPGGRLRYWRADVQAILRDRADRSTATSAEPQVPDDISTITEE